MRALQFAFASRANRSCCLYRAPATRFANRHRIFFRALARHIAVFHRRHLNVEIDPVEQGARNALTVPLNLDRTTTAFAFQVAKISAGAGIHRRHEHKFARESETARRP
jgi:hypothetical protein